MRLRSAARDSALVAPSVLVLVLVFAYAVKEWPHPYLWLAAGSLVIARFALVALGMTGRGTRAR
jgi:hypothetical protein